LAVPDHMTPPAPIVIRLPGEIDVTNAGEVLSLITGTLSSGAAVIIADLTDTRFCDSAGLRHLLLAHRHAARAGPQLRLVILPDGPVGRVIKLTGVSHHVPVYSSVRLAIGGGPPPPS